MKRLFCTVILALCMGCLSAQSNRFEVPTEIHEDERFVLDSNFRQEINYEYRATDSIYLSRGFFRHANLSSPHVYDYTMLLDVDGLGVYPPGHGEQGGPNNDDTGVVGALGGTVDVGAMGGATYTIPIELPAGINGMQPSLALTYNSQGGNGLLGWKWELAGLSSITRTGKTRYHDGVVGGVTLNDITDRFMLDGQRLITMTNYGDSIEYRLEQDDLSKIMAYKATEEIFGHQITYNVIGKFKVWKANGTILEYGYTEDSHINSQSGVLQALCWLINKISDRNGNSILFSYNTNQQTGEYYISQIFYTDNQDLGINPEFVIDFVYSNTDMLCYDFKYVGGSLLQQKKYLEHIKISRTDSSDPLEQYTFEYRNNENPYRYDSVQMYHRLEKIYYQKGGRALNPTNIQWTSNGDNNVMQYWGISDTAIYNNFPFVGDFNADGYSDLVVVPYKGDTMYYKRPVGPQFFLNNRSQGFNHAEISMETQPNTLDWIHVVDINDDGYDDLVTVCYDSVSNLGLTDIMVYKNRNLQNSISFEPVWNQPLYLNSKVKIVIGDFLGQGKRSLLVFGTNADGNAVTRAVYVPCDEGWCFTHQVDIETGATMPAYQIEAGEYMGDGCTELFVLGENNSSVWKLLAENDGFVLRKQFDVPDIQFTNENARSQVFTGDFNGDGLTDLLSFKREYMSQKGYQNIWSLHFSKGNGFVASSNCPQLYFQMPEHELYGSSLRKIKLTELGEWYSVCTSDFNGDGITDVAVVKNYGKYSSLDIYFKYRKENHRFLTVFDGSSYNGQHYNEYPINCKTQYMHIGNFLGKENCSFLGLRYSTGNDVQHLNSFPRMYNLKSAADLNNVKKIVDGMGNITRLDYGILLQGYKNYGYGVRRIAFPIRTLKTSTTYNVTGKPVITDYNFSDLCFHRDGHGFLGFGQIVTHTINNGANLNKSIMNYSLNVMQDYALLLPSSTETYVYPTDNDNVVKESKTTYFFLKAVNSGNSLVTCPALVKKEFVRYNVDSPSAGMLSKEITENDYSYTLTNNGQSATYLHNYDCIETRTGVHNSNVDNVSDCDFRTTTDNEFDNINVGNWILGRMTHQVITQSMTGKEDKVNTVVVEYSSNDNYQVSHVTNIPNTEQSHDRLTVKTDYLYYPTGNLQSETVCAPYGSQNEPQRTTAYEYGDDNKGRLVTKKTITAGGLEYENNYSYDAYDNMDTLIDHNDLVTTYDIDAACITSLTSNPDGTIVGEAYRWAAGHPLAPDSASYYNWKRSTGNGKQLNFYHKSGEVLRTVAFGPKNEAIITDVQYDDRGLTKSVSNPYFEGDTVQWTGYEYDHMERLSAVITPDETRTEITHQGLITRTLVHDVNGNEQKTKRVDNIMGWMVSIRDPQNVTINYDYYADGSLAYTQIGNNTASRISIGYDSRGNRDNLSDPDYGTSTYLYDAYGSLVERISPKSDTISCQYDPIGRLTEKRNSGESVTTTFVYDETEGLKGTLKSITHGNNQSIQYSYDVLLRPIMVSEQLFGTTYETSLQYDRASRICQITHPTGVTIQNEYSFYGHLIAINDAAGNPLWEANRTNATGQLLQSTMGGNIVTNRLFDSKMHYIKGIATSNNLQNLSYGYDKFGNLARRTDSLRMMTETFEYDQLNRLTDIYFDESHCRVRYDNLGRMVSKQGVVWKYGGPHVQTIFSTPEFDEVKIHALTDAVAHADWFDDDPMSINYTSFDKVSHAINGDFEVSFEYGFNEERIRMNESHGACERQKTYLGSCEFITESDIDAVVEKSWTFLTCPIGVFAVVEKQGEKQTLHYILKDHQGSWTVIADAGGRAEQELSYDAWGNLRNPATWCIDKTMKPMFDRGYTGQEHLDGFGLINMNGRMYDPVMSSFLSVDRYVQQPDNSQGFNRYAYCMYNPLRYVDPSGWLMSNHNGGGIYGGAYPDDVPVPSEYDTNGDCAWYFLQREVVITPTSGGMSSDDYPRWSSDRGFGNPDIGGNVPSISEAGNYGGCGSSGGRGGISIDYNKSTNFNICVQSLDLGNGLKTEILDASVRYNYKSNRTWYQWELKLSARQRNWRIVNTLGKEGATYLKVSKGLGFATASISIGISALQIVDYVEQGGRDVNVFAKSAIDAAMVLAGFCGPIGFGISMVYFITDLATDGFWGWGKIPNNYKENRP